MDDSMTMYKMKCLGFVVEATQKKVQRYQHDSIKGLLHGPDEAVYSTCLAPSTVYRSSSS